MNSSQKLNFESTITTAFNVYKKTFLTAGFAFFFILMVFSTMFLIGADYFFGMENFIQKMKTFKPEDLSPQGIIIYVGCMIILSVLIAPFNAGFLKMMKDANDENQVKFNTVFHYVNSPYFSKIVVATILVSMINFSINFLLQNILGTESSLAKILPSLLSIILTILCFLTIPNIVFGDLSVIDAIKKSANQTSKNFFYILSLLTIGLLFGYLGIFIFIIGLFFTFPFYFCLQYAIFKEINK